MANQPKKYKKFVATAATATLVASAIVPVASAASFKDVPENNEFAPYIDALTEAGIINGYPSTNTFKPGAALTRGQVVKMLGRWVESNGAEVPADWKTKARFTDVPTNHKDQELVKYAALVADEGVFGGAAGKLMAATNITRQQMAKVLNGAYAAVNGESLIEIAEGVDNVRIPDLASARAEYEDAIQALMDLEISSTTSGNFRPLENVTRAQFSKFLYNTINFEASDVAPFEIKAVNSTTVEVIFAEDIENIDKVKFEIDGLKVTNAVVKQTSKRTAVLTTESQKGGTEYTVKVDGEKAGTFVGIAAVLPEKIDFTTKSIQGVYGKQVTVSAKVTVPQGQSAEGVSVTFNIDSNKDAAGGEFAKDYVAEAFTNADGIATYTYTQYNPNNSEDSVTAYATGKANVRANAKVYWGNAERLAVKDITEGSTIANSNTKVYQVSSAENAGKYVAVTFKQNIGVTPDKVVNGISFTDAGVYNVSTVNGVAGSLTLLNNSLINSVPFEVTTGGHQVALVKLNSSGVGNFTLTGSNATVTPVVYAGAVTTNTLGLPSVSTDVKYDATDLQAVASEVTFAANQTAEVTVEAAGVANAAARNANSGTGQGGREYTVTLKDKNGKIAPKGTNVTIFFDKKTSGNSNNQTPNLSVTQIVDKEEKTTTPVTPVDSNNLTAGGVTYQVDDKGQVTFVVRGQVNDFATPIVVYDNGRTAGILDTADAQKAGDIVYFGNATVGASKVKVTSVATGKEVTQIVGADQAKIEYIALDQNGFPYYNSSTTAFDTTFSFVDPFANYSVTGATLVSSENGRKTYKTTAVNGVATVYVSSNGQGTLNFTASTTNNILTGQTGTIGFNNLAAAATLTGTVKAVDTTNNKVTITVQGQDVELPYTGASLFYKGSAAGVTETYFESKLLLGATVTYNKATETTPAKFDIIADPAAAADVPVTVTSAVALDNDGNGTADRIKLTFSKPVDETKLTTAYLGTVTLTGGTVANTVVSDASPTDNSVTLTVTGATGLTLGTLSLPALVDLGVDLSDFAGTSISPTTAVVPTLVAATGLRTAGTAVAQQETLTVDATAATNTGNAIVTVRAAGFNGGAPLNIDVPVTVGDNQATVAAAVRTALQANTTVTNFFNVTGTGNDAVLTVKTAAANDATMNVSIAGGTNNVVIPVATSVDTTAGALTAENVAVNVSAGAQNAGTVTATVADGTFNKAVSFSVAAGDNQATVAGKLFAALYNDTAITSRYNVTVAGPVVTLTNKALGTTPNTSVIVR